jgi:hypothetical protein
VAYVKKVTTAISFTNTTSVECPNAISSLVTDTVKMATNAFTSTSHRLLNYRHVHITRTAFVRWDQLVQKATSGKSFARCGWLDFVQRLEMTVREGHTRNGENQTLFQRRLGRERRQKKKLMKKHTRRRKGKKSAEENGVTIAEVALGVLAPIAVGDLEPSRITISKIWMILNKQSDLC